MKSASDMKVRGSEVGGDEPKRPPRQWVPSVSEAGGIVGRWWNAFSGALTFLTRVPVPWATHDPIPLKRMIPWFPIVGLVVAGIGVAVGTLMALVLPVSIAMTLALAAMVAITGAFHEDGLADATDGVIGGSTIADRLAIMKDSRLGTYGAVALWFSLTARWGCLTELFRQGIGLFVVALAIAHTWSRALSVSLLLPWPYLRRSEARFERPAESVPFVTVIAALMVPVGLTLVSLPIMRAGLVIVAATSTAIGVGWILNRKLGGMTGDCLGAVNQGIELVAYIAILM